MRSQRTTQQVDPVAIKQKIDKIATPLFYVSTLVFLIGVFLLYQILISGKLAPGSYGGNMGLALQQELATATTVFTIGLWMMVFLAIIRWPAAEVAGWLIIINGFLLYAAAAPILLKATPTINLEALESPGYQLITFLRTQAFGLMCLGAMRVVVGLVLRNAIQPEPLKDTTALPGAPPPPRVSGRRLCRNCWDTSFCRSPQRENCPRFRQKTNCWKAGAGCHCDAEVAVGLMPTSVDPFDDGPPSIRMAAGRSKRVVSVSRAKLSKQKSMCPDCPIYHAHQEYLSHRYRAISWIVYPIMIVVTFFLSDTVRWAWHDLDRILSRFFGSASILIPAAETGGVKDFGATLDTSWVPVFMVGILLISLGLKFVHRLIVKFGI